MEESQKLKNLKANLEAAVAEHDRLTKQAAGLPSIEKLAFGGVHAAKKAVARGEVGQEAVEEARGELRSVRELRDDLRFLMPEAKRAVFLATISVEKQIEAEAGEQLAGAWEQVVAKRAEVEAAEQAAREATGRATRYEGIINRAQRNVAEARRAYDAVDAEDKRLLQQEALNEGLEPRAVPASRGNEVVFDSLQ